MMKALVNEMYREAINELEKIKKTKLLLSERVALEKALVKLEDMKKILNYYDINPLKPQ